MPLRNQRMPPGLAERSSKMYILPTPTHLEVVALGDSSDISPDQHLNYASDSAPCPLFQLAATSTLTEYSYQHGAYRRAESLLRITTLCRFIIGSRGERDDAQGASALGALGPRAQRAQNSRRTCCFRRRVRRVLKQRVGPERGGAKFEHYYARWRPGRAVGAWFRACSDGCSTKRAEAFG